MGPPALRPVLIVDDCEDDLQLIKRTFAKAGVKNPVVTFQGADEAMSFLRAASHPGDGALRPCLVFTDLKMPGTDGIQLVKWIRSHKQVADLTVIMFSHSDEDGDRNRAEVAGVDEYFTKLPKPELIARIVSTASCR
jgi:CheY-like chemotaxis protein